MNKNLTNIVFLIDRSWSMMKIRNAMIEGFNGFIGKQKVVAAGTCKVFQYQFDNLYETVYENKDLSDVPELTVETFIPRSNTALYSSLGKTIVDFGKRLDALPEDERPGKVLFVTITDGENNTVLDREDKQYTAADVATMVKHQTEQYQWDFAYIGANQDAWATGDSMGYASGTTLDYLADDDGTALMFDKLARSTSQYRQSEVGVKFCFSGD
jgi:hypothetical protein